MGLRIKEVIKEKGMTVQTLADKMGINRVGLSNHINGNPSVAVLEKIAAALKVPIQELFEKDFNMFFRKKGNFNRPSVYLKQNRMSVRFDIIFGVQLFAGVQLVLDQQSKNESY